MRERRLELDAKLREILGSDNVYFQPPNGSKLKYPCIVYSLADDNTTYANNYAYTIKQQYEIKYIDTYPVNDVVEKILRGFQMARFVRRFTADRINHDVIMVYY